MSGLISEDDILRHASDVKKAVDEKRKEAGDILVASGSLPDWWDINISLGGLGPTKKSGAPQKFASPDEYLSLGFEYLEECAKRGKLPTKSGLILHLGFANQSYWVNHARRNPQFREPQARLLSWLQLAYEDCVHEPGGQSGKTFVLKNIPEGLLPEDPSDRKLSYAWKDRQSTELTGADGGPLEIDATLAPADAYRRMLEGGTLPTDDGDSSCE